MKKLFVSSVILVALLIGGVVSAKERIEDMSGTIYDSIIAVDTAKGATAKFRLTNAVHAESYDGLVGWVTVVTTELAALASDTVDQFGESDSSVIYLYAGTGPWKQLIAETAGTASTKDTIFFRASKDIWANGAVTKYTDSTGLDTLAALYQPSTDTLSSVFLHDWFWMEYHVGDAAGDGAGDSILVELQYFFRFYEED